VIDAPFDYESFDGLVEKALDKGDNENNKKGKTLR
jgi:hypothetical protein